MPADAYLNELFHTLDNAFDAKNCGQEMVAFDLQSLYYIPF